MGGIVYIALAIVIIVVLIIIYTTIKIISKWFQRRDPEGQSISKFKRENNQEAFFGRKRHTAQVVDFYGESKELDVNYYSTNKIKCDQEELNRFVGQIINNHFESFFVLENNQGNILEISNPGESDVFDIVYIKAQSNIRFIGEIEGIDAVKLLIDSYFKNQKMIDKYKLIEE